ncbi:MAG TPA: hypothetical protein VIH13_02860 [Candidatus Hydromicrobium sp.]
MRIFLIIFSFINTVFYVFVYSYFDNILDIFGITGLSSTAINYIKLAALLVVGFCIGITVMLILRLKIKKNLFSFKNLLIVGIFPFICLILSEGSITSFIINKFFNSSERLSELVFYLFSRQTIWSLWLGFAIGTSIRFSFLKKEYKHLSVERLEQEHSGSEPVKVSDIESKDQNHFPQH